MSEKHRFQTGSVIIEISDYRSEDQYILLTVSKARYDEDAVQIQLPSHIAKALGNLLIGETE